MKEFVSWLGMTVAVFLLATPPSTRGRSIKQVVIKEVTRVEGRIQKPEVWYLLPPASLNYEGLKLEQKLVPKIEDSLKKEPF